MSQLVSTTLDALAGLIAHAGLTKKGQALVAAIRSATDPARRVHSGRSVTVRFLSVLMGRAMHLESRSFELPVASHLDRDGRTREFFEQPTPLNIPIRKEGALRATTTTFYPDFFAIRELEPSDEGTRRLWLGFIDAKSSAEMADLAIDAPERYVKDAQGRWHDLLIENHVRETYGLEHEVLTDADLPAIEVRNETYLEDYLLVPTQVPSEVRVLAIDAVRQEPGISGTQLRERCEGLSVDMINQLASDGAIWFPRESELIRDLARVHFYPSALIGTTLLAQPPARPIATGVFDIAIGSCFRWGDRRLEISNFREDFVDCLSSGEVVSFKRTELERLFDGGQIVPEARPLSIAAAVANLSPKAQARFIARSAQVQAALAKGTAGSAGARKWLADYRRRERVEGHGIRALIPGFGRCGRWGARKADADIALAREVLEQQYLTPEQRVLVFAYGVYRKRFADEIGDGSSQSRPMSRLTFTRLLNKTWSKEEIARSRHGYKAANAAALRGPLAGGRVDTGLPVNGDRAWERVHIDHTLLDIWVTDSATRSVQWRVWATIAVDAYSGAVLAIELSLEDPSNRLPMQLLRRLVRQYHRLPQTIITDNGKEFRSTYFQTFCATYGIRHEYRPPAHPRFGSPAEGGFHRLNVLVHTAVGNAKPGQDPRSLDKDLHPSKRAVWTLAKFDSTYISGALDVLNAHIDPVRNKSHAEILAESVAAHGIREQRRIAYDTAFLSLSALPRANDLLVGSQGIEVDGINYWSESFRDNEVQGTFVPVRDEPFDISRKYAHVKGAWRVCATERFRTELEGRTESEIEAATKELKSQLSRTPSLDEIVEFVLQMQSVETQLADEQRALRKRQLVVESNTDETQPVDHLSAAAADYRAASAQ